MNPGQVLPPNGLKIKLGFHKFFYLDIADKEIALEYPFPMCFLHLLSRWGLFTGML